MRCKLLYFRWLLIVILLIIVEPKLYSLNAQNDNVPDDIVWFDIKQIPSPIESRSWFPDLVVDTPGNVHVMWNETAKKKPPEVGEIEQVFYSYWNGQQWSPYNDILAPQPDINRFNLIIDNYNFLHLINGWFWMYHRQAPNDKATDIRNWSKPNLVNGKRGNYFKEVVEYNDMIHVLYDDRGALFEEQDVRLNPSLCSGCSDMHYARSLDRGETWLKPMNLHPTEDMGASRPDLVVDKKGILYAIWSEGWDRLTDARSANKHGVFMRSDDMGETWSQPTLITYPDYTNTHFTIEADGNGGVMLVWRTEATNSSIFFMWSTDYGETWLPPRQLPNIIARPIHTAKFDKLDMEIDSAGQIHLLIVARPRSSIDSTVSHPPYLYHLKWDGVQWSTPIPLYKGDWYPEYPTMFIANGNQLHATWFIRDDPFETNEPYQIWYAYGEITSAPTIMPEIFPTLTPTPTPIIPPTHTPTSIPPTATPTATIAPEILSAPISQEVLGSIYTTYDELYLLFLSMLPASFIVICVVIGVRWWRRR